VSATPRHLRIFLSSPGDVGDERQLAIKVMENLPYDPLLTNKVTIQVVAWDKPGQDTPLLATMTPQEAINRGLPKPSECQIVIVIFWSRMGTPLPFPEYQKENGERYLSGTEWEYEDALHAAFVQGDYPQIIVYRRVQDPPFTVTDPAFTEKQQQYERVGQFFTTFSNPDGSISRGYNQYNTPEDFREKLESHLKALIKRILEDLPAPDSDSSEHPLPLWEGSPFPGLRAFTPDDEPIFFGRGRQVDTLIDKVNANRVIAVFGASGSGKSSMVAAGLIPRLQANAIEGSKDWLLPTMRDIDGERRWSGLRINPAAAGDNPFAALATQLAPLLQNPSPTPEQLAQELGGNPEHLDNRLVELLKDKPAWAKVLLFVDQFEELFTLVSERYRAPFVRMLENTASTGRARIVITVRADFFERMMNERPLLDLLENSTQPLAAPGPIALYEMIRKPADRANLDFEAGLIEKILEDTGQQPGALALLAYALDELYRARTADGRITFDSYQAVGGVRGAIARRAEVVLESLTASAQAALPALFRKLAEVNEDGLITRRAVLEADVDDPAQRSLADALASARLLYLDRDEKKQPIFQVAHEALFTSWERLARILDAELDFYHWRRRLTADAELWLSRPDSSLLYFGSKLAEAERYLKEFPDDIEADYKRFIRAGQRRRLRNRAIQYALLAVPIIVSLFTLFNLANQFWLRQTALADSDPVTFSAGLAQIGSDNRTVHVERFSLDRYEISYRQYRLCVQAGACGRPQEPPRAGNRFENADDNLPVTYVSAYDAAAYCTWVGGRLPTMEEWERAARGIEGRIFPWGTEEISHRFANIGISGSGNLDIMPVRAEEFAAGQSPEGIMHLVGNAAEWTASYCRGGRYADCDGIWDGTGTPTAQLRVMGYSHLDQANADDSGRVIIDVYPADPAPSTGITERIGIRCAWDAGR
jgi:hypothetical protein